MKPLTSRVAGPAGSSLSTVMVAVCGPNEWGWKRSCTSTASPGSTVIGSVTVDGTSKVGSEEAIEVTVSRQPPLLLSTSGSSRNSSQHTWPK